MNVRRDTSTRSLSKLGLVYFGIRVGHFEDPELLTISLWCVSLFKLDSALLHSPTAFCLTLVG